MTEAEAFELQGMDPVTLTLTLTSLHQIMALTADGLNLAGVRRVLELQEETRRLKEEIERLGASVGPGGNSALSRSMPFGERGRDPVARPQHRKKGT